MTSPEDAQWRRPADPPPGAGSTPPPPRLSDHDSRQPPGYAGYAGPPLSAPPPPGWRPEYVIQPAPPRAMPPQDHADLDAQEQSARTLTYGIGLVAGALLLIVLCALCGRALF